MALQLWIRRVGEQTAVKIWDGTLTSDLFQGSNWDAALGIALRTASDAVLRDTSSTDPKTRVEILFTRGVPE